MEATETIVLYRESDKKIISEVFEGQKYYIPDNVQIYIGTKEDFMVENPEYKNINEIEE